MLGYPLAERPSGSVHARVGRLQAVDREYKRISPRRSPSSSSAAPRSGIVACVRCSRTSEPIPLSHEV
jgi:hypothetical protein